MKSTAILVDVVEIKWYNIRDFLYLEISIYVQLGLGKSIFYNLNFLDKRKYSKGVSNTVDGCLFFSKRQLKQ